MRHDIVPAIRHQQITISSRLFANDARGVRMYVALELLRRAIVSGVDDSFYSTTASRTGRLNSVFFFWSRTTELSEKADQAQQAHLFLLSGVVTALET
jgi:hypothetical protein